VKTTRVNTTLVDLIKSVTHEVESMHLSKNKKRKLVSYIVSDIIDNSYITHGRK